MRFKEFLGGNSLSEDDKSIEKNVTLDKKIKYKNNEIVLKTIKHLFKIDLSDKVTKESTKNFTVDYDLNDMFSKTNQLKSWIHKNYRVERNGGLGWAVWNTKK